MFGVPAAVILIAIAALLPHANDRAAEVLAGERNGEIAALLARQLSRDLIGLIDTLDRVAAQPEIYEFEPGAQKLALRALVSQLRPFDAGVVVVDRDGRVSATDSRAMWALGANWSDYPFARYALNGGAPAVISDVAAFPPGDIVALALPMRVPGQGARGFIAGLFNVDPEAANGLADAFAGLPIGAERRLIVLDSASRPVFDNAPGASAPDWVNAQSRYGAWHAMQEGGEEWLIVAVGVPETEWRLALGERWATLATVYRGATRLVFALLLLGISGPLLIAAVGLDRITRSIATLTAGVKNAAGGQLGEQVKVRTGDEIELLADQFNEMSARLSQSYAELEQRVAERTAELNRLYEQAKETATLAERNRLARELHDSVTQTVFSAKLIADVLPKLWERDPTLAAGKLEELRRLTAGALAEMRALLVELRPSALAEADLAELLANLAGAAQARTPARIAVTAQKGALLPSEVQEAFYRIAQEALNNAVKHANATAIRLEWVADKQGNARLAITDDGIGFNDRGNAEGSRFGLRIMRERAESVNAELNIASKEGSGTAIVLRWRS